MNNQDFITREAALIVANTEHLYGTALTLNVNDVNAVEKFTNFNGVVRLALTTVAVEAYKLQEEAK